MSYLNENFVILSRKFPLQNMVSLKYIVDGGIAARTSADRPTRGRTQFNPIEIWLAIDVPLEFELSSVEISNQFNLMSEITTYKIINVIFSVKYVPGKYLYLFN